MIRDKRPSRAFTRPEPAKGAPNAERAELDRLGLLKTDDEEFIPKGGLFAPRSGPGDRTGRGRRSPRYC
jgi:hypothetical protein